MVLLSPLNRIHLTFNIPQSRFLFVEFRKGSYTNDVTLFSVLSSGESTEKTWNLSDLNRAKTQQLERRWYVQGCIPRTWSLFYKTCRIQKTHHRHLKSVNRLNLDFSVVSFPIQKFSHHPNEMSDLDRLKIVGKTLLDLGNN